VHALKYPDSRDRVFPLKSTFFLHFNKSCVVEIEASLMMLSKCAVITDRNRGQSITNIVPPFFSLSVFHNGISHMKISVVIAEPTRESLNRLARTE
jgi:hypothetical protein